ncbi:hypothetical protein OPQ81_003645 [Rhizoctonia solani]|nr:hypothetical protein OPQ81_003645 [Rhizoctonia solani]
MEYNLSPRHNPLAQTTLQNVLKVPREIECLGRILQLKVKFVYQSLEAIPPLTLRALRSLSLEPTSLLSPSPTVVTLLTYIAIVHRLSACIGSQATQDLIKDFNRTTPSKTTQRVVRKVPGTGPRVQDVKRPRKSSMRTRDLDKTRTAGRRSPVMFERDKMLDPMCSVERLADPKSSLERLVDAHPVMSMGDRPPIPWNMWYSHSVGPDGFDSAPVSRLRHTTSRETLDPSSAVRQPRTMRSWETFAPVRTPAPLAPLSLPARSKLRPYPYPCRSAERSTVTVTDSAIQLPDSPTSTLSSNCKRRSIRGLEYLRNTLGRISRIYSSEAA